MARLLVLDTHPIQYRSPVFKAIFRSHPDFEVVYFDESFDGRRWWFHEVGKIPPQKFNVPLQEGFPNHVLGVRRLGLRRAARELGRWLDREKPSAVLLYGYYLPEHWLALRLCRARGIRVLFVGETFESGKPSLRRFVKTFLRRYFLSRVDGFLAIGKRNEDYYLKLGIPPERIVRANYCIDTRFFEASEAESRAMRSEWRQKLGIPESAPVLLFVGRLFERKRPHDVLDLHKRVSDLGVHTVIAGNGFLEKELRGDARVHLIGFQDQHAVRRCYHGADLLVVPSEYETWGLVVNEAFACGTPALVTDTCGSAGDLVVHDQTGGIFKVGDVESAARWVRTALEEPGRLKRLGLAAKARVTGDFSVDRFAQATLRALKNVVSA